MQLAGPPRLPEATEVPGALRGAADALGQRPAITVLRAAGRRDEQGFASLLQWTAKGAHLLEVDWGLGPGDRVGLVGPAGWLPAAVCLACWWIGAEVVAAPDAASLPEESLADIELAVVHESLAVRGAGVEPLEGAEVLWWGDAVDGTRQAGGPDEDWAIAVQSMPDQPPPARGHAGSAAITVQGAVRTQSELLAAVPAADVTAAVGCSVDAAAELWVPAIARPLVTGRPTVLLAGADREAASGDRVAAWVD